MVKIGDIRPEIGQRVDIPRYAAKLVNRRAGKQKFRFGAGLCESGSVTGSAGSYD